MDMEQCLGTTDDEGACAATVRTTTVEQAKKRLNVRALNETRLTPLDCKFGVVKAHVGKALSLESIVRKATKKQADCVVAYVLRHPACGACREKGKVLSEFVSKEKGVAFFTVVKESGVVDKALIEYYSNYGNRYPIYQDPKMGIYQAMGGRKVSAYDMARGISRVLWRSRKTGVAPNLQQVAKGVRRFLYLGKSSHFLTYSTRFRLVRIFGRKEGCWYSIRNASLCTLSMNLSSVKSLIWSKSAMLSSTPMVIRFNPLSCIILLVQTLMS